MKYKDNMTGARTKPYRLPLRARAGKYFANFKSPFVIFVGVLLLLQSLTIIFSLYWMASTSLKSQINFGIDNIGLPKKYMFENYAKAFTYLNVQIKEAGGYREIFLPELIWNSLLFSFSHVIVSILAHAIASYVLAKFQKFRFVRIVQAAILVTIVMPVVSSLSASLDWNKTLGVYDNLPMIVYTCIAIFDSTTLIFIGAYAGVHDSYIEAAKIDGAGNFRILFTIAMPLIRTVITVMSVTSFIGFWNNYMTPYIYLPSTPTLAVALLNFSQSNTNAISSEPMQMAAAALVCLPCLALFFVFRDKMVGNLTMGGIKG